MPQGRVKKNGRVVAELGDDYEWRSPPDDPLDGAMADYFNAQFHPIKNGLKGPWTTGGNFAIQQAADFMEGEAEFDRPNVNVPGDVY